MTMAMQPGSRVSGRWRLRLAAMSLLACGLLATTTSPASEAMLAPADPESVGMSAEALDRAIGLLRGAVERDEIVGAVVLVARDGRVVAHEAIGRRDQELDLPMAPDTIFYMASNTKALVAAAIARLHDQGRLDIDAPVRQYIPEFDNARARDITIRHLLTNTSGLPLFFPPDQDRAGAERESGLVREARRVGGLGSDVPPGSIYQYSNPGFNVLGALVELRSGLPLQDFLRESFYLPLGMVDSYNQESVEVMGRDKVARRSALYYERREGRWVAGRRFPHGELPGWKPGDPAPAAFVSGSGSLLSTARDYAAFYQMLLDGGIYGGRRLLSRRSVDEMTRLQTEALAATERYGYGLRIRDDGNRFEHSGSAGTFAWADRRLGIVGLVLTQTFRAGDAADLIPVFQDRVARAVVSDAGTP